MYTRRSAISAKVIAEIDVLPNGSISVTVEDEFGDDVTYPRRGFELNGERFLRYLAVNGGNRGCQIPLLTGAQVMGYKSNRIAKAFVIRIDDVTIQDQPLILIAQVRPDKKFLLGLISEDDLTQAVFTPIRFQLMKDGDRGHIQVGTDDERIQSYVDFVRSIDLTQQFERADGISVDEALVYLQKGYQEDNRAVPQTETVPAAGHPRKPRRILGIRRGGG